MILEDVTEITRGAGKLALNRSGFEVKSKGGQGNFVSSVDLEVQEYLSKRLPPLVPGSAFLGEEGGGKNYGAEYLWIVDPIDGTANFIRGLSQSAVSVALVKNGEAQLGVVYHPFKDELFRAERGKGAFLNGRRIEVSDRPAGDCMACLAWSLYDRSLAAPCFRVSERLYAVCEDLRRTGSAAIELSDLAAGRVDLFFEARLQPWDYAAALLIVREAGGTAGNVRGGIRLDRPGMVLAANSGRNYALLSKIVAEAFEGIEI